MISYRNTDHVQGIFNHPEVRPGHIYEGRSCDDLSPIFEQGGFSVSGEGFAFVLAPVVSGVYEVHSSVLPEYRNRSKELTELAMSRVFIETQAIEIVTRINNNPQAKRLALSVGMRPTFKRGNTEYFSIDLSTWSGRCEIYREVGEDFHELLEEEGIEKDHGDDPNHDQFVGIALEMAKYQPIKAERFYNQWAHLAGFHPCYIVNLDPLRADFGTAMIEINEGIRVCRQEQ